ncbi:unnamed protein product [Heligmosomoides polygyrus]|uniref:Peptidase_M3 domain-containing protein n=1 Tax=Heligmosomoides polygyrus TaxID=6339 RepID=A0A183GW29_HELPZ|nr:unnamed protein product [Heligmosomoides polygyrus]
MCCPFQASYALFDLELHAPDATRLLRSGRITTTDLFHSIITKALPHLNRQPDSAFQHRFHHLVQYGAKYYSYLVARSAASLIWNSKFSDEPFNRSEGEKWMEVQSYGGGLPSAVLLEKMLGYKPTALHFIEALKQETSHLANLGAVNHECSLLVQVQSYGGGLPSAVLLEKMLGYKPTALHFIEALKQETSHLANLGAVNV